MRQKDSGDNGTRSVEMKRKAISRHGSIRRVKRGGHITTLMAKLRRRGDKKWEWKGMELREMGASFEFVPIADLFSAKLRVISI